MSSLLAYLGLRSPAYLQLSDDEAALKITSSIRSFGKRKKWTSSLKQLFGSAQIEVAREYHRARLAHDPLTGELYPLDAPDSVFDSFGEGVAAYIHSTKKFQV